MGDITPTAELATMAVGSNQTTSKVMAKVASALTAPSKPDWVLERARTITVAPSKGSAIRTLQTLHEDAYFVNGILPVSTKTKARPLQELRNEVRRMVADGRPQVGIALYQGRRVDGDPVAFLKKHYAEYLPQDRQHTLFLHDLRDIDETLVTALENERKHLLTFPLGTKSDLLLAVARGSFFDGPGSRKRLNDALRMRNVRVNT